MQLFIGYRVLGWWGIPDYKAQCIQQVLDYPDFYDTRTGSWVGQAPEFIRSVPQKRCFQMLYESMIGK